MDIWQKEHLITTIWEAIFGNIKNLKIYISIHSIILGLEIPPE